MRGGSVWVGFEPQPRKSPPRGHTKKGGPAGGGGRGLVGGWCPPPGPEKSRRSVWRGPQGPTGHGDENKNRAQTALLDPPRRGAPPRDPPPAPSANPRHTPSSRLAPDPGCPSAAHFATLSRTFPAAQTGPLPPITERGARVHVACPRWRQKAPDLPFRSIFAKQG